MSLLGIWCCSAASLILMALFSSSRLSYPEGSSLLGYVRILVHAYICASLESLFPSSFLAVYFSMLAFVLLSFPNYSATFPGLSVSHSQCIQ